MRRRTAPVAAALAALAVSALVVVSTAAAKDATNYQVTITNLTDGQPLTPPAVATHRRPLDVFEVGAPASFGVKEIAENGNLGPLLADLAASPIASASLEAPGGPLVPEGLPGSAMFDDTTTFTITAAHGANYLSFVSMLICTNDGFTGVSGLRLPKRVGDSTTVVTNSYDAGTEVNTEDFADMVPPCQGLVGISSGEAGTGTSNPALAEGGVIHMHPGIAGNADLIPAVHGWTDPVALVTIEAVG
jgi:Spondin_N